MFINNFFNVDYFQDTQTSYRTEFGGSLDMDSERTTMGYFKKLADQQNYNEIITVDPSYEVHRFAPDLFAIHFYHNVIILEKGDNTYPSNFRKKMKTPV